MGRSTTPTDWQLQLSVCAGDTECCTTCRKNSSHPKQEKLSLMLHGPKGEGDAGSGSSGTSRWSSPSRLYSASNSSYGSPECRDRVDALLCKISVISKAEPLGKKAQKPQRQKSNHDVNNKVLKLPLIKPLQVSRTSIQSANNSDRTRVLQNQVRNLQQQLNEARSENKLLQRLQRRHMVALQHFQDSEGSLGQILTKHENETRVLQRLLRESRICRDSLTRQLQTSENTLQRTKASLQHLQELCKDHNLLQREELTLLLSKATKELQGKDKRIVQLESNLHFCEVSFNRQIATEKRKVNEAKKESSDLQQEINQLRKEIQNRRKELDTLNIYSHRCLKGFNKEGRENKIVQTHLSLFPIRLRTETEEQNK